MRAALRAPLVFLLLLSSCGPAPQPRASAHLPPAPVVVAPAPAHDSTEDDQIDGPFTATTRALRAQTGDVSISADDVSFANGLRLQTTHLGTATALDVLNSHGESFKSIAPGDDGRVVDIRRIDSEVISGGDDAFCPAGSPATYVALVHDEPITKLSIIIFTGADAPAQNAADLRSCAVLTYAANPDQSPQENPG